jgi:predicted component of type VI protein secretion system
MERRADTYSERPSPRERSGCVRERACRAVRAEHRKAYGSLVIEDLNSSNGTYVNRSRVPPGKQQGLKANDIIQIGEVQLKVLL